MHYTRKWKYWRNLIEVGGLGSDIFLFTVSPFRTNTLEILCFIKNRRTREILKSTQQNCHISDDFSPHKFICKDSVVSADQSSEDEITFFSIFIRYFLHLHFKCYLESPLYPPPALLPNPPTPASWPWHSPVLGHMIFTRPRGLSSQWWPTRPSSATYAARVKSYRVLVSSFCCSTYRLADPFSSLDPFSSSSIRGPVFHSIDDCEITFWTIIKLDTDITDAIFFLVCKTKSPAYLAGWWWSANWGDLYASTHWIF